MTIQVVEGDATSPERGVIVHVVNDRGGWGKGFVNAVSRRWAEPERAYRSWARNKTGFELGRAQIVPVGDALFVANVLAQSGTKRVHGRPPIRYEALEKGLAEVARFCAQNRLEAHMPRIGCGLAGGTWDEVEPLIERTLVAADVPVTVYDWVPLD